MGEPLIKWACGGKCIQLEKFDSKKAKRPMLPVLRLKSLEKNFKISSLVPLPTFGNLHLWNSFVLPSQCDSLCYAADNHQFWNLNRGQIKNLKRCSKSTIPLPKEETSSDVSFTFANRSISLLFRIKRHIWCSNLHLMKNLITLFKKKKSQNIPILIRVSVF